jgi:hypothetical protein
LPKSFTGFRSLDIVFPAELVDLGFELFGFENGLRLGQGLPEADQLGPGLLNLDGGGFDDIQPRGRAPGRGPHELARSRDETFLDGLDLQLLLRKRLVGLLVDEKNRHSDEKDDQKRLAHDILLRIILGQRRTPINNRVAVNGRAQNSN